MLYSYTVKFDMIRVRNHGVLVPRHNVGLQRAVRGELHVRDEIRPDLRRHSRTAIFRAEGAGDALIQLYDVQLMHVTDEMMVLSGIEADFNQNGSLMADFAQTWVLRHIEGHQPLGSMGPAYLR
jgi:hypothetical protein